MQRSVAIVLLSSNTRSRLPCT